MIPSTGGTFVLVGHPDGTTERLRVVAWRERDGGEWLEAMVTRRGVPGAFAAETIGAFLECRPGSRVLGVFDPVAAKQTAEDMDTASREHRRECESEFAPVMTRPPRGLVV